MYTISDHVNGSEYRSGNCAQCHKTYHTKVIKFIGATCKLYMESAFTKN